MKQIVMAPCQPINCRRETFAESVAMAREKESGCTLIWARERTKA